MEILRLFLHIHHKHPLRFVWEHESHTPGIDGWFRVADEDYDNWVYYMDHWKNHPDWALLDAKTPEQLAEGDHS